MTNFVESTRILNMVKNYWFGMATNTLRNLESTVKNRKIKREKKFLRNVRFLCLNFVKSSFMTVFLGL